MDMEIIKGSVQILTEGIFDCASHAFDQLLQKPILLRLVSLDRLDPDHGEAEVSSPSALSLLGGSRVNKTDQLLAIRFSVRKDFGRPGAILLDNHHSNEFYLKSITLEMPDNTQVYFPCYTWINHSKLYFGQPRVLFTNDPYLPSKTPPALLKYRRSELVNLRGDGTGERKYGQRIYDFDVYNDLSNPDEDIDLKRPVLGGSKDYPYPRRCRTGRKHTKNDELSEKPMTTFDGGYLPRDGRFSKAKKYLFMAAGVRCLLHHFISAVQSFIFQDRSFLKHEDIHELYVGQLKQKFESTKHIIRNPTDGTIMEFPPPGIVQANNEAWKSDEEFGRQRLAGNNPLVIQRLESFPPMSSLDPEVYGNPKSSITEDIIEPFLEGFSVTEALEHNLLYILDYHDALMPYINRINKQEGKTYASRTILYLTRSGRLVPIAIELTLPPEEKGKDSIRRVFTPGNDATHCTWHLAKTHVAVMDAGYHQLASHWLRTHACIEPIIIATARQLSIMHPIHILLSPHFKDTLHINAFARSSLINAGGKIETHYTAGKYCLEISSAVYKGWRFDQEALPEDLLKRGMAIRDLSAEHGLRLTIEDYPYAVDGLELWGAIRGWVEDYVKLYYEGDEEVAGDEELQKWWEEVRKVGHGDHGDADWWPAMASKHELMEAMSTIIWLTSAHHAAVNFGQYAYAGYMPNSPCMARELIPEEGSREYERMLSDPEAFYLKTLPATRATTLAMAVLEMLAQHMSDEEYLGERIEERWTSDERAVAAMARFRARLEQVEASIGARNATAEAAAEEDEEDEDAAAAAAAQGSKKQKKKQQLVLRHRVGEVLLPYTLLVPSGSAGPGLTFQGVPNSISI